MTHSTMRVPEPPGDFTLGDLVSFVLRAYAPKVYYTKEKEE